MNKEYVFKVKFPPGQTSPKAYRSVTDYPPENPDPNSPDYSVITPLPRNKNAEPTGIFYKKNFGDFVTTWSGLSDEVKEPLARGVIYICWKISWIEKEIGKLTIFSLASIKEAYNNKYYNNDDTDYDALTLADRIVGDLLWQWGYYYSNNSGIVKFDLTPILPTQYSESYLDTINQYYNALVNFYEAIYYKEETDLFPDDSGGLEERSDRRVTMLIKILPGIAVNVIPIKLRLEILDNIIKDKEIYEDEDKKINEADVLKILNSFLGYVEANILLDYLAVVKTGNRTRYEILYKLMDDNRLERYPFISWFVDDANNKQFYNFLLYEKWKTSKYNMYYIPPGGTENENGLNPNAYFLSAEGIKYFKVYDATGTEIGEVEPILEYSFEMVSSSIVHQVFNEISYQAEEVLNQKLVVINQKTVITNYNYISPHGGGKSTFTNKYGNYHIYQPIALIGYEGNLDFDVPQFAPIPAFLLFYSTDYNRLKTYDAIISFTAEVAIEIGLFFATGGLGAIRHLKHLKHLNKIGAAFRNTLPASEAVIVWRGAEAGTEILSVSAGVLYSTTQLIANTTTSQATYELMQRLGKFFLVLTFTSAGSAIYSRQRAVRGANEVIREIDHLSDVGIPHGLSPEVIDVLYTIRNTALVSRTLFRNRIATLTASELGEANHIADLYDNLDDAAKTIFYNHFADKAEDTASNLWFWKQMNKTENTVTAARMKAWTDAPTKFQFVRRDLNFLDNVVKLKITDRKAYEHLAEFANRPKSGMAANTFNVTGGHKFNLIMNGTTANKAVGNGVEILDPNFAHSINNTTTSPRMTDYLSNTKNNLNNPTILPNGQSKIYKYLKKPLANGHFEHNDILIKEFPQPPSYNLNKDFVLNGVVYKLKSVHTQLNPNWSEADIIYEHAYALFNKGTPSVSNIKAAGHHGRTDRWIEVSYESFLMDGTKVNIKHVNYQRYNLQTPFDDHFSYFHLEL